MSSAHPIRVLGLVVARGGSKGVPRKNLRLIGGQAAAAYTGESALAARRLSRVILSTEDPEIADVGRRCGLEVPFCPPGGACRRHRPGISGGKHALQWMEEHAESFDALCLLQPTNPLRRPEDIDGCVELLEASGADAVVSILAVPAEYNPHWVYFRGADGHLRLSTGEDAPLPRRQELPPAFHREGSVYVTRRDVIMHDDTLYGTKLLAILWIPHAASTSIRCPTGNAPKRCSRGDRKSPDAAGRTALERHVRHCGHRGKRVDAKSIGSHGRASATPRPGRRRDLSSIRLAWPASDTIASASSTCRTPVHNR